MHSPVDNHRQPDPRREAWGGLAGLAFFHAPSHHHLPRLSFVTVPPAQIEPGIALLAQALDA